MERDHEGFTKVERKGKGGKHPHKKANEDRHTRKNNFKILEEEEGNKETIQDMKNATKDQDREAVMEDITIDNQQKNDLPNMMEISRDQGMTPCEVGTKDHELQEILDKENMDLEQFLEEGINKGEVTAKALWDKLGTLYQSKSLVNKLFLQKKLYNLRMKDGDSVIQHLNAFNTVVSQLLFVDIKFQMKISALVCCVSTRFMG